MGYERERQKHERQIGYFFQSETPEVNKEDLKFYLQKREKAQRFKELPEFHFKALTEMSRYNYARYLMRFARRLKSTPLRDASQKQINAFISGEKVNLQGNAKWAVAGFYAILGQYEKVKSLPYIERRKIKPVKKSDLWAHEEIVKLYPHLSIRDKAIVQALEVCGCRINEILSCKYEDYDDVKKTLSIKLSKTEPRINAVMEAAPAIGQWLNIHPKRRQKKGPLFCNTRTNIGLEMSCNNFLYLLKRAALKAGVNRPIKNHMFRHVSISRDLNRGMPALIVLQKHGLDPKSTMLSRYGHADDSDVQKWERRVRGMAEEETTKTTMPANPECPNCFSLNAIGDELCAKCGTTLDRAKYQEQRLHEAQTKAAQETRLASLEKEAAETRALLREMGEKQMLQKYGERKIKKKK